MGWFIAGGVAAVLGVVYVWASRRSSYRRPDQIDAATTQAMIESNARSLGRDHGGFGL